MVGVVLRHLVAGAIILAIGLTLGYRPQAGVPGVIAAFALLLAVGFGTGWVFIVLGLLIRTPTTVMTLGFTFLFPLVFASNIMVQPATMPDWLRLFVEANPISDHDRDPRPHERRRNDSRCRIGARCSGRSHRYPRARHPLALPEAIRDELDRPPLWETLSKSQSLSKALRTR